MKKQIFNLKLTDSQSEINFAFGYDMLGVLEVYQSWADLPIIIAKSPASANVFIQEKYKKIELIADAYWEKEPKDYKTKWIKGIIIKKFKFK